MPLFVLDTSLLASDFASPNRVAFLLQSLADLDASLRRSAARSSSAEETPSARPCACPDGGRAGRLRERRRQRVRARAGAPSSRGMRGGWNRARLFPGVTIVGPGELRPTGGDHFRVFTPYWNRWRVLPLRSPAPRLRRIALPRVSAAAPSVAFRFCASSWPACPRPTRSPAGSRAGARLDAWLRRGLGRYPERRDDLAADATSRLSAYLHFGCLSPVEVARAGRRAPQAARRSSASSAGATSTIR